MATVDISSSSAQRDLESLYRRCIDHRETTALVLSRTEAGALQDKQLKLAREWGFKAQLGRFMPTQKHTKATGLWWSESVH